MSIADEIEKLNGLRQSGALSEEEYQKAKETLLSGIQAETPSPPPPNAFVKSASSSRSSAPSRQATAKSGNTPVRSNSSSPPPPPTLSATITSADRVARGGVFSAWRSTRSRLSFLREGSFAGISELLALFWKPFMEQEKDEHNRRLPSREIQFCRSCLQARA